MIRLLCAVILFAAITSPALAIDFNQTVKTFDGKDFVDQTGKPTPLVLGVIVENSLLQTAQSDTIDTKNKQFWLALKIHDHPKDPALSAEELALIKKVVGTYQPIAIMGQALRLIDPASVPKN